MGIEAHTGGDKIRQALVSIGVVVGGYVLGSVYGCTTQVTMEHEGQDLLILDQTMQIEDRAIFTTEDDTSDGYFETWEFGALVFGAAAFVVRQRFIDSATSKR